MSNDGRGEVRFIRKNGRVIPIRNRQGQSWTPGQTIGAGVGMLIAKNAAIAVDKAVRKREKPADLRKFKQTYSDLIRKAGNPKFVSGPFDGAKSVKAIPRGGRLYGPESGRIIVLRNGSAGEATILHELGHLAASRKKGTANWLVRSSNVSIAQGIKKPGKRGLAWSLRNTLVANTIRFGRPFVDVVAEAEASSIAIKSAAKSEGIRKATGVAAKLALPYGTYVGHALGIGLIAAGAVKAISPKKKGK